MKSQAKLLYTYFLFDGEFVKIGRSSEVLRRIAQIKLSTPRKLKLLRISGISESTAHREASALSSRVFGEWFEGNENLLEYIEKLPKQVKLERMGDEIISKDAPRVLTKRKSKRGRKPTGIKKVNTNICLTVEVKKRATKAAFDLGISLSELITRSLERHLKIIQP